MTKNDQSYCAGFHQAQLRYMQMKWWERLFKKPLCDHFINKYTND